MDMELLSNASSLSETDVTLNDGFFKKIFTRADYRRMSGEDNGYGGPARKPVSLVKIKKTVAQIYENHISQQPQGLFSSSSTSTDTSSLKPSKTSVFQPVKGAKISMHINRSHSSQCQQPLTRLPVFDFSDQSTYANCKNRVELKRMSLSNQKRSSTFDSTNSTNRYYESYQRPNSNQYNLQGK